MRDPESWGDGFAIGLCVGMLLLMLIGSVFGACR